MVDIDVCPAMSIAPWPVAPYRNPFAITLVASAKVNKVHPISPSAESMMILKLPEPAHMTGPRRSSSQ